MVMGSSTFFVLSRIDSAPLSVPEHRPADRIESGEQEGDNREEVKKTFGYVAEAITSCSLSSRDSPLVLNSLTGIVSSTLIESGSFGFAMETVPEIPFVSPWTVCHVESTTKVTEVFVSSR
jgi:hypothetical protein